MSSDRYQVLQRLDENQNAVLGVCAGIIEAVATQPLTFYKNMKQQGQPFTIDPRKMYRGQIASCANDGTLTGLQFLLAGTLQKIITGGVSRDLTFAEEVGAGWTSGFISGVPCCMLELTMIQQQRHGGTTWGTPKRIIQCNGYSGMFRGFWPSAGRESFFTAGYLGVSPWIQRTLAESGVDDHVGGVAGALISGVMSAALTHPMDTIKSCMQGDIEQKKYRGVWDTGTTLYKEGGGGRAFFRGFTARASMICICFWLFNEAKLQLGPFLYPNRFDGCNN